METAKKESNQDMRKALILSVTEEVNRRKRERERVTSIVEQAMKGKKLVITNLK